MKFPTPILVSELAEILSCSWKGLDQPITGLNEIHVIEPGELVFVDHPKYYDKALHSSASCILINKETDIPEGKAILLSENPFSDFNTLSERFKPFFPASGSIHPETKIGENTTIQPGVFIGPEVVIGKNCRIHANVTIQGYTEIGDDVIIQSGTILGSDAFYYKKRQTHFERLKSSGKLIIEDKVEIGANCTIDRGVSGETVIGEATIIDNLVHIGHDTKVGKLCLFAAQVGLAGCVRVEDEVTLWGQVGAASDITIGSKAVVLAQAGISKSLEGNTTYFGYPADEARAKFRELAALRQLPEKIKQLK